ncbi:MAG: SpoVA/SpoVAEb family sporulation membrane protein [Bacilli bacterium]|nr:SpoVA/SpoVAEb family sporulation membrane protein [Bacilli bacterium]
MIYVNAFLFSAIVCLLGEILMTKFKLKPGVVTSLFVVIGSSLELFNIYDYFLSKCGGGAMVVITSFGHSLTHGAFMEAKANGLLGLFTGMFNLTAAGITSTIIFAFITAILFKPKC